MKGINIEVVGAFGSHSRSEKILLKSIETYMALRMITRKEYGDLGGKKSMWSGLQYFQAGHTRARKEGGGTGGCHSGICLLGSFSSFVSPT